MFKLIITVKKKAGISLNEFIRYYEGNHAPLLCKILPPINEYRRNYVIPTDPLAGSETIHAEMENDESANFHVFTELIFADREGAQTFLTVFFSPDNHKIISEDESKFVAPNGVKAYVVEVYQSPIPA